MILIFSATLLVPRSRVEIRLVNGSVMVNLQDRGAVFLPASFESFSSAANVASRVISAMSFNSAFFRSVRLFKG